MPSTLPDFLYGTAWKEDRSAALIELALRRGFRAIDTANQRRHYFEAGVGESLAAAYPRRHRHPRRSFPANEIHLPAAARTIACPTIPPASLAAQVAQSLASSLEHLATDHVDSFVLHGPSSGYEWTDADAEVWEAMREERDAGRTRLLGVSNVALEHLEHLESAHAETSHVRPKSLLRPHWMGSRSAGVLHPGTKLSIRDFHCSPRIRRFWGIRRLSRWRSR